MDNWQSTFLGLKQLPRELTAFEIEAFFAFTLDERQVGAAIEGVPRQEQIEIVQLAVDTQRIHGF